MSSRQVPGRFSELLNWAFLAPSELAPSGRRVRAALLLALYLLGLAHWGFFLDYGRSPLDYHDWPKESGYFNVLRQAIDQAELPLHAAPSLVTERFLANPEVPLSPQVLLLPSLDDPAFVLLNTALMYTVGFLGLLALGRRLELSITGFAAFYLLFNFNGSLTAHLAVGHSMWVGYFLLPFCLWLIRDLAEKPGDQRWSVWLALTCFGMLLVGAYHFVVWYVVFLILVAVAKRSIRAQVARGLLLILIVGAFRILPAAIEFGNQRRPFVGGFQSSWDLLEGLAVMKSPFSAVLTRIGAPAWWEVDYFIGLGGLALVLAWAIVRMGGTDEPGHPVAGIVAPALVLMTLLSLDPILRAVSKLPLPLIGAERVASRFFLVPLLVLLTLVVSELDRWLRVRHRSPAARIGGLGMLVFVTLDLWQHSRLWRVDQVRLALDPRPPEPIARLVRIDDPSYLTALILGVVISLVGLGVCAWLGVLRRQSAGVR